MKTKEILITATKDGRTAQFTVMSWNLMGSNKNGWQLKGKDKKAVESAKKDIEKAKNELGNKGKTPSTDKFKTVKELIEVADFAQLEGDKETALDSYKSALDVLLSIEHATPEIAKRIGKVKASIKDIEK